jgi:4-diphosphocytidyl-2-C-methyl-D-erythritol kinase
MLLQHSKTGSPAGAWIAETPAKINLFFEVLGKRSDGFHEIVSIAVPIRLFDTLSFESTDDPQIRFDCHGGRNDVPVDETNLVVRAAKCIQQRFNVHRGAAIKLTKRIPSQSGLGGGSSDAAAALRLACRAWNLDVSDSELLPFAAELGSDCPIFFYDVPTISKGRGEQIQPLPAIPPLWFVLIKPPEGLSTAAVYAECLPLHDGQFRLPDDLMAALVSGDVHAIGRNLFNRLEVPAQKLWHRFDENKDQLLSAGCLAVQMSGSGTAFFGLCENESHAKETLQQIHRDSPQSDEVFLCCTSLHIL